MQIITTDLKRALPSWGFIISFSGMTLVALLGVFDQIIPMLQGQYRNTGLPVDFTAQLILSALSSDTIKIVLPILCAIPFTSNFLDEYKSRYVRSYLLRSGLSNYVKSKVIVTALSGGLALLIGLIVTIMVFTLIFLPLESSHEVVETVGMETVGSIEAQQNFALIMQHALLFFLNGCLWSLLGGLMATITMSKYMAYASPFIIYFVLVILSERYLKDIYIINPQEWVNPQNEWVGGIWGVALLVGELVILTGFSYAKLINVRLKDA